MSLLCLVAGIPKTQYNHDGYQTTVFAFYHNGTSPFRLGKPSAFYNNNIIYAFMFGSMMVLPIYVYTYIHSE